MQLEKYQNEKSILTKLICNWKPTRQTPTGNTHCQSGELETWFLGVSSYQNCLLETGLDYDTMESDSMRKGTKKPFHVFLACHSEKNQRLDFARYRMS